MSTPPAEGGGFLVFITKVRCRILDGNAIERLRSIFSKVCLDFEAQLVELDGQDNHVHLLVNRSTPYRLW
jgi:putative transposase